MEAVRPMMLLLHNLCFIEVVKGENMANKIISPFLILLISFASCEKNKIARQVTHQISATASVEKEDFENEEEDAAPPPPP
jgi:hypothetical protein